MIGVVITYIHLSYDGHTNAPGFRERMHVSYDMAAMASASCKELIIPLGIDHNAERDALSQCSNPQLPHCHSGGPSLSRSSPNFAVGAVNAGLPGVVPICATADGS